jgi:hypothetical protein
MSSSAYAVPQIVNLADFNEDTDAAFVHLTGEQWDRATEGIAGIALKSFELLPSHLDGGIEFRFLKNSDDVLLCGAGASPLEPQRPDLGLQRPRLENGQIFFMPPLKDLPERPPLGDDTADRFPPSPPKPCRTGVSLDFRIVCRSGDCGRCVPLMLGGPSGGVIMCHCLDVRALFRRRVG